MSDVTWQKSTYSGSGQNDCLELATAPAGTLHLRESDDPSTILNTSHTAVAGLLATVKRGGPATQ
ncbi:DUF397 domain-containing protein [Streptomyces oceani]|uniref:DUF397 domain-containing protein n=1 Tax=Streptomyces oceani TaxID=1075402 RepID=A0A1E7KQ73_9ACTN|nr:DUF397 domain-containing protein [Streptomyces oceani]OEV06044.1 hypothetical protein AN216_00810 [Streptomyces oceani]